MIGIKIIGLDNLEYIFGFKNIDLFVLFGYEENV